MLKEGKRVDFWIYDPLFKDVIFCTGVLVWKVYDKLWKIRPDYHERLSGGDVMVHENAFELT